MSINREMKPMTLQVCLKKESVTGAELKEWTDYKVIDVAIYKSNDLLNTQSVRYNESSHTGLTHEKDIEAHRCRLLYQDGTVYDITSANTAGRFTTLLLKVVDTDAG